MKENYKSRNRHKYYLKCHLIFCVKYRRKILVEKFDDDIKAELRQIADNSDFGIDIMETDKDHVHFLISYPPKLSVTSMVRKLKQESTVFAWRLYGNMLRQYFWKEKTLWSDGYFVCSIGEANPNTIREYIRNKEGIIKVEAAREMTCEIFLTQATAEAKAELARHFEVCPCCGFSGTAWLSAATGGGEPVIHGAGYFEEGGDCPIADPSPEKICRFYVADALAHGHTVILTQDVNEFINIIQKNARKRQCTNDDRRATEARVCHSRQRAGGVLRAC